MSYDIWLEADLGGEAPVRIDDLDWNYTSNVAPMWRIAMPESDGLAEMHGMEAGKAADILVKGIERMGREPEVYRALNPRNGWGNFEGQLEALQRLLTAFRAAPKAKVVIWR